MRAVTNFVAFSAHGRGFCCLMRLNCFENLFYTAREPNKEEQYEQDMMEMAAEEDMEDGDEEGGSG